MQPWHENLRDHRISCEIARIEIDSESLILYNINCKYTIDSVLYCDTIPCADTCYSLSHDDISYQSCGGKVSGRFSEYFWTDCWRWDVGSAINGKKQGTWETLAEAQDTFGFPENLGSCSPVYYETYSKYLLLFTSVYKDGLRDGPFVAYNIYTSKVLYKTIFVNGTGYEKTYYQCKGTPIRSEGQFTHDKKTGKWIYYSVTGKKKVVYY